MSRRINALVVSALAACLAASAAPAQNFSDSYTFLKAVRDRDGDKVQTLLNEPGTIVINTRERATGEGPVHIVTKGRDLTWLGFLLGKGAKADLQDNQGNTALMIAAQIGWTEGAETLIRRRASVNMGNRQGETALILAVQRRDPQMVSLLLASGADPRQPDSVAGYSAIDYARQDSRSAMILKMLEAPAAKPKAVQGPKM